jgi:hypothetical protein
VVRPAHTNPKTMFGDHIDDRFVEWLVDNPTAVSRFVSLARANANREKRVGAKAIVEALRIAEEPIEINNSYTARLARFVMREYPDLAGYFNVRELRAA